MDATDVWIERPGSAGLAGRLTARDAGAPGVLIVHGLGSRKENHRDFADHLGDRGLGALAMDLPGHGDSAGELGPDTLDGVMAGVDLLVAEGHMPIGIRGSSLGAFLALHAAERHDAVRAVVAICPATASGLARRVCADWPLELGELRDRPPRAGVARGYWHARGDAQVDWAETFALACASPAPRRLHIAMGGSHQSLQHDPRVLADSADLLATALLGA